MRNEFVRQSLAISEGPEDIPPWVNTKISEKSNLLHRLCLVFHTIFINLVISVPQIPDYCTEEIPEMNQNCTSDRDCFEGLTCIKDQGRPFCFDNDIYFQTGKLIPPPSVSVD